MSVHRGGNILRLAPSILKTVDADEVTDESCAELDYVAVRV